VVKIFRDYIKPGLFPKGTVAPEKVKRLIREFRTKQSVNESSDYIMRFNGDVLRLPPLNPARVQMSLLAGKPDVANGGSEGNNNNNGKGYKEKARCVLQ